MYEKQFEDVKGMYVILDGNKYYVHDLVYSSFVGKLSIRKNFLLK